MKHNGNEGNVIPFDQIIELLFFIRENNNIFDLIANDYSMKISNDSICEIADLKPTFVIKIKKDLNVNYKEFDGIMIDKQELKFVLFKKKNDMSFNVSYKIQFPKDFHSNLKILSVLTLVRFNQDNGKIQINFKIISNTKLTHNIFNSQIFDKETDINIYLKICYTNSTIQNIILFNYNALYKDIKIAKISKNNLFALFQNSFLDKYSENYIAIAFCNWLNDEKNINEDVQNIIEIIKWQEISIDIIFEFVIQFSLIIEKYNLELYFTKIIEDKVEETTKEGLIKETINTGTIIAEALFRSSKRINLVNIYNKLYWSTRSLKLNSIIENNNNFLNQSKQNRLGKTETTCFTNLNNFNFEESFKFKNNKPESARKSLNYRKMLISTNRLEKDTNNDNLSDICVFSDTLNKKVMTNKEYATIDAANNKIKLPNNKRNEFHMQVLNSTKLDKIIRENKAKIPMTARRSKNTTNVYNSPISINSNHNIDLFNSRSVIKIVNSNIKANNIIKQKNKNKSNAKNSSMITKSTNDKIIQSIFKVQN